MESNLRENIMTVQWSKKENFVCQCLALGSDERRHYRPQLMQFTNFTKGCAHVRPQPSKEH